jgi:hypothetical protein
VGGAPKEGTEETRLTLPWYSKPNPLRSSSTLRQAVLEYPFEVALPEGLPMSGVVLADHVKSADWSARRAQFVACGAPKEGTEEARLIFRWSRQQFASSSAHGCSQAFKQRLESQGRTPAEMSLRNRLRELGKRRSGKV